MSDETQTAEAAWESIVNEETEGTKEAPQEPQEGAEEAPQEESATDKEEPASEALSLEDVQAIFRKGDPDEIREKLGINLAESAHGRAWQRLRSEKRELKEARARLEAQVAEHEKSVSAKEGELQQFATAHRALLEAGRDGRLVDALCHLTGRAEQDVVRELIEDIQDPGSREARRLRRELEEGKRQSAEEKRRTEEAQQNAAREAQNRQLQEENDRVVSRELASLPEFAGVADDSAFRGIVLSELQKEWDEDMGRTISVRQAAKRALRLIEGEVERFHKAGLLKGWTRGANGSANQNPGATRGKAKLPAAAAKSGDVSGNRDPNDWESYVRDLG